MFIKLNSGNFNVPGVLSYNCSTEVKLMAMMLNVLSGTTLLMFVMFLAANGDFRIMMETFCGRKLTVWALLLLLPVFLFIPAGMFASFVNLSGSVVLVCCFMLISRFVYGNRMITVDTVVVTGALTCISLLLCVAQKFGFPGTVYSLDVLSSVSVWRNLPWYVIFLVVITDILFVASAILCVKNSINDLYTRLFVIACCSIAVSYSIPFNVLTQEIEIDYRLYIAGFVCFWTIVFGLKKLIFLIASYKA